MGPSCVTVGMLEKPSLPSKPWTIILYQDGVDPGDTAVKEKSRHSIIFYWSFLELGMRALCREEMWSTSVVTRTHLAKCLIGGPTELTHRVVRMFHGGVHDMPFLQKVPQMPEDVDWPLPQLPAPPPVDTRRKARRALSRCWLCFGNLMIPKSVSLGDVL